MSVISESSLPVSSFAVVILFVRLDILVSTSRFWPEIWDCFFKISDLRELTIHEIKQRIQTNELKKQKLENETSELSSIIDVSSKGANKYETKIKFVKGIMHEDYSISKLKHDTENLGIEGLVYEILSWDKKYERSVLAVSSDWIKAVVVKDFSTLI